jgi:hypothetical protein
MSFVAGRKKLPVQEPAAVEAALSRRPLGRLVQALLDKAYESQDRWWALQRLEARLNPGPESRP